METNQFTRVELLIGKDNLNKLKNKKILVLGLGGVGSYVVEALVRSGVENIVLVDYDNIDITNLNRQVMTNLDNVGKKKTSVLLDRILSINKDVNVVVVDKFIDQENISCLFEMEIDYFVDCCDTVLTKKEVIKRCLARKIKFITCMGTGNKLDPSKLEILDIRKTSYDPLAKKLRKWVNDEKIKGKILCCASVEQPLKITNKTIASIAFVPASAGLLIASYIVKDVIDND